MRSRRKPKGNKLLEQVTYARYRNILVDAGAAEYWRYLKPRLIFTKRPSWYPGWHSTALWPERVFSSISVARSLA